MAAGPSDYVELKRRVRAAGLLELQPGRAFVSVVVRTVVLVLCVLGLALFRNPWALALGAVALGLVSGQLGFQLHDAGHHQLFARAWRNRLVGFVTGDLLMGLSFGWWMDEHVRHHTNPNHLGIDPDLDNAALSYSLEQALERGRLGRFVARHQAFLLVPLTTLTAWSMHAQGFRFVVRRGRWLELAALLAHTALYAALLVALLGPWWALLVAVIQKAVTGVYVAAVILPNHQGMAQTEGAEPPDFLRRQVMTTRNLTSNWLADLWFGSLNLQVEHHLFPRMTPAHLRRARPIVKRYCEELGIAYHEVSVPRAYLEVLLFLHAVGEPLRRPAHMRAAQPPA